MSNKKNKVLEVSTLLFAKYGFEKTSMATICLEAKVSKGLVYHHFKSKEAILIEIFTQTTEKMVELNKSLTPKTNPNAELQRLIHTLFSQLETDRLLFQFNLNLMFQPTTRALLSDQIKKRASILFNSVKRIFDQISLERSEVLSYLFIAEIDGIALNYLSIFENYPLEIIKEELIKKYQNDSKI